MDRACHSGSKGHDHLHCLQLHEGLSFLDVGAICMQVTNQLAVEIRTQLGRIPDLGEGECATALDTEAHGHGFLDTRDLSDPVACSHVEGAIWLPAEACLDVAVVDGEAEGVRPSAKDLEVVLHRVVGDFDLERLKQVQGALEREMAALHPIDDFFFLGLHVQEGLQASSVKHHIVDIELDVDCFLCDEFVEPSSVDGVIFELLSFGKLDQVLSGIANFTHDENVLECQLQCLSGMLSGRSRSKQVTELGVCKLVDGARVTDGKVAPAIG
mmetsp:Transcript_95186/g.199058  ORF Transcript_95186/g.199058 Transcript_95186/m.199058 type:complete len:270 (+) Transcript_95186:1481-2290(+)